MKRVRKPVATVHISAKLLVHVAKRGQADSRGEHQGSPRRARDDGTVHVASRKRVSPDQVPNIAVGGSNAPQVLGVIRIDAAKAEAVGPVSVSSSHRIMEVINAKRRPVAETRKIKPRL